MAASANDDVISDEALENMLESLEKTADTNDINELLAAMNENEIITREEAENILQGDSSVVKCGLPEHVRPSDPENKTDVDECISKLEQNDPTLTEINLNNMKRTPIPHIRRLLTAIKQNTHLTTLNLANLALTDSAIEPLLDALETNTSLKSLNIETNYITGDMLAKLFRAALKTQTLEIVKAVNQSPTFSTEAEMEIMKSICANNALVKVSIDLRHPEARNKVELTTIRNADMCCSFLETAL
ncbi:unnamed protein product [Soboliphyme baturini]|uniref:Tropomodulin n=1 Tax=Soboliphyme baturini TaxID=241478 RepID=A0A183J7U6_9BILA|nr:unnamed protein product [Soboliphyme baturini]